MPEAQRQNGTSHLITTLADLQARYGEPSGAAVAKELDHISPHYRQMIEASPFVVLATVGPEGLDCSPRGDPAGLRARADDATLMLPDRRGNNRIDSLRNIVRDPRVALLFLIPGVGETLRVNGRAAISRRPRAAGVLRGGRQGAAQRAGGHCRASISSVRRRSSARSCGIRRPRFPAARCHPPARWCRR